MMRGVVALSEKLLRRKTPSACSAFREFVTADPRARKVRRRHRSWDRAFVPPRELQWCRFGRLENSSSDRPAATFFQARL